MSKPSFVVRYLLSIAAVLAGFAVVGAPGAAAAPAPDGCEHLEATIVGTDGDDVLFGTPGRDVISAGDGNDVIRAMDGHDVICAGDGNDSIYGGAGDDYLDGGAGDDSIYGGIGTDYVHGGVGDDTLLGRAGDDVMTGGPGHDLLNGGGGDDLAIGDDGNDVLLGRAGNDRLAGVSGQDKMRGGQGDDVLVGGTGHDPTRGGTGTDTCEAAPTQKVSLCETVVPMTYHSVTVTTSFGGMSAAAISGSELFADASVYVYTATFEGLPVSVHAVDATTYSALLPDTAGKLRFRSEDPVEMSGFDGTADFEADAAGPINVEVANYAT